MIIHRLGLLAALYRPKINKQEQRFKVVSVVISTLSFLRPLPQEGAANPRLLSKGSFSTGKLSSIVPAGKVPLTWIKDQERLINLSEMGDMIAYQIPLRLKIPTTFQIFSDDRSLVRITSAHPQPSTFSDTGKRDPRARAPELVLLLLLHLMIIRSLPLRWEVIIHLQKEIFH